MNYKCAYKQFLVKSIKLGSNHSLPEDIIHEINGFVFYDKETSHIRKIHHDILNDIKTSFCKKKRMGQCEDWAFVINHKYFAGMNCRFCGNYLMSHQIIRNMRLFCFCDRELVAYEENLRRR